MKCLEFYLYRILPLLVKFDVNILFYFLGLPQEIFFGVTTDDLLHR